jgi:tetratricopeptide (TPR) repeat protein
MDDKDKLPEVVQKCLGLNPNEVVGDQYLPSGSEVPIDDRPKREYQMSEEELLALANNIKMDANQKFAEGEYSAAINLYTEALKTAPLKFKQEHSVYLSNRAAAHIKLSQWNDAISDASESIEVGAANEKSLERRAFAYSQKEDTYDKAIEDYKQLREQFPDLPQYTQHLVRLEKLINERNERMKNEAMTQLKNLGNM